MHCSILARILDSILNDIFAIANSSVKSFLVSDSRFEQWIIIID